MRATPLRTLRSPALRRALGHRKLSAAPLGFGHLPSDILEMNEHARAYFMSELHPLLRKMDDEDHWPAEVWPALGKQGYLGLTIGTEYGGAGLSFLAAGVIGERYVLPRL